MLDFDLFRRVVDEVGASLVRIDFFNYGEAFLHKRAVEMCEYIKTRFPGIYLYTSTNGLALTEEQARRLVHSGIDEVTFSIDGATPESYVKYRQRGRFDLAIATLGAMADEKQRARSDVPFLNWRYILFKWNDSDAEMALARQLAQRIGVDRLCWELTDHPEDSYSRRFIPGSPDLETIRQEIWDDNNLGNAMRVFEGPQRAIDSARTHRRPHAGPWRAAPGARRPAAASPHPRSQSVDARLSGAGELRPPARAARRPTVRWGRGADRPRFCARLAAADRGPRRPGGRGDRNPRAPAAGTLRLEVRFGERRDRLVRALRIADDDPPVVGEVGTARPRPSVRP